MIRDRLVVLARRVPPSAHTSTLAAECRPSSPQGALTAVTMRPQATALCERMGPEHFPPPQVELYQPQQPIIPMSKDELAAFILGVCETYSSLCMDVPSERTRLAMAIAEAICRRELRNPAHTGGMPICRSCLHRGEDHNWTVPECFRCARRDPDCTNCRRNRELDRVRGACLYFNAQRRCSCSKYVPLTDERKPVNRFAARLLRRKRR